MTLRMRTRPPRLTEARSRGGHHDEVGGGAEEVGAGDHRAARGLRGRERGAEGDNPPRPAPLARWARLSSCPRAPFHLIRSRPRRRRASASPGPETPPGLRPRIPPRAGPLHANGRTSTSLERGDRRPRNPSRPPSRVLPRKGRFRPSPRDPRAGEALSPSPGRRDIFSLSVAYSPRGQPWGPRAGSRRGRRASWRPWLRSGSRRVRGVPILPRRSRSLGSRRVAVG